MSGALQADLAGLAKAAEGASPAATSPRGEIYNIQILRLVAAMMVLIGHAQHEVLSRPFLDTAGFRAFNPVWWAGGVDVFFVISGFIMCYISRTAFASPGAPSEFMARRLVRLVPLYWAVTTAMLLAILLLPGEIDHSNTNIPHVVASYLFLPWKNAYGGAFPLFIGGWTLNYEMLFYVVFATSLLFRRKAALLFVAGVLVTLALLSLTGVRHAPWSVWTDPIVLNFLYGIGIAILYERGLRWSVPVGLAIAAVGVAVMVELHRSGITEQSFPLRFLWAGLPAAVFVLGPALMRESGRPGPVRRLLVFGGDISYALYLTHPFFLGILAILFRRSGSHSAILYVFSALAICIAGAALIYLLAEKPAYTLTSAWLRRRLSDRRARRAASV